MPKHIVAKTSPTRREDESVTNPSEPKVRVEHATDQGRDVPYARMVLNGKEHLVILNASGATDYFDISTQGETSVTFGSVDDRETHFSVYDARTPHHALTNTEVTAANDARAEEDSDAKSQVYKAAKKAVARALSDGWLTEKEMQQLLQLKESLINAMPDEILKPKLAYDAVQAAKKVGQR